MGNAPWGGGLNVNCGGLFCLLEGDASGGASGHETGKDGGWAMDDVPGACDGYDKDVRPDDVPWANGSKKRCRGFFRRRAGRDSSGEASSDRCRDNEALGGCNWLAVLDIQTVLVNHEKNTPKMTINLQTGKIPNTELINLKLINTWRLGRSETKCIITSTIHRQQPATQSIWVSGSSEKQFGRHTTATAASCCIRGQSCSEDK